VPCSCVVVTSRQSPCTVRPCAADAAPPKCPTRAERKRRASGLLGPRGTIGVGVGVAAAVGRHTGLPRPIPAYIGVPNQPRVGGPIRNPKPSLIRVQPELGLQPLKRATLWAHVHMVMGRVLLLAQ